MNRPPGYYDATASVGHIEGPAPPEGTFIYHLCSTVRSCISVNWAQLAQRWIHERNVAEQYQLAAAVAATNDAAVAAAGYQQPHDPYQQQMHQQQRPLQPQYGSTFLLSDI